MPQQKKTQAYLDTGTKRVLISAPVKTSGAAVDNTKTIVYGVNHDSIDGSDKFFQQHLVPQTI